MPIKLDNEFLVSIGLGDLSSTRKNEMLSHIYSTLELRVGNTLAAQMTNDQLGEFEAFIDAGDEPGALEWLQVNFPHYTDVVAEQFEALKAEIIASAPAILAAEQAAAQ